MSLFKPDWAFIRRHTLLPSLSAIGAVTTLVLALWAHDFHHVRFLELHANQNAVHSDYDALLSQRRLIDRYHRRYQKFHELGFIGRESRLDWVETLRTTAAEGQLPRLSYSIEPQLGVTAPVASGQGGDDIQIRVSRLQLDMGLIHELDLLRFFDALQSKAPGLIKVNQCDIVFEGENSNASADANLSAVCTAEIFSVITSDVAGEAI